MSTDGGWITLEEWLLLSGLLIRGRPCGIHDLVVSINPPPTEAALQARWRARQRELVSVFLRLYRRGLVREAVPLGERTADVYELTRAGTHLTIDTPRRWAPAPWRPSEPDR